ncbi:MAG: hypothetical protein VYB54_13145 [Pseudomonadota bacterium]|nr:hypothetical protein [Pseudomonadota bacterium]
MLASYRHLAGPAALLAIFAVTAVPTIANLPYVGGPLPLKGEPWREMETSEVWQQIAEDRMRYAVREKNFLERIKGYLAADSAAEVSVHLAPTNQGAWIVRAEAAWRSGRKSDLVHHVRVLLAVAPYETYRAANRIEFALDVWDLLSADERAQVYDQIRWAQWWIRGQWWALMRRRPDLVAHWIAATEGFPEEIRRRELLMQQAGIRP